MKMLTLDVEYECDFDLFGVVSSSREHKLAWTLNHALRLRLVKQQDLIYDLLARGRLVISNYLHTTEAITLRLLRNRSLDPSILKKPFLAPDIKEYDYLIQVSNGTGALASDEILDRLTRLPEVQYACQFDPNSLKFKENLLF
ncbi:MULTISPECIES: IPExxxVDY family protein [Hymenobacter]|uniref:IPExxxVDY family protein n=1 Tax=Hymenobacter jejuensis TaxID=2502781 RepID=A0A5B7ZWP7_9BACT|nr:MULTISPECIES: IPExxxVDY family protein [Hymenobacter]MBC6988250.1 IPExxxVDY family protein [Hymenobacter sp. BT491]QDA59388.1 IPExxxVDY family protein [Hymenobacter jejuensis]